MLSDGVVGLRIREPYNAHQVVGDLSAWGEAGKRKKRKKEGEEKKKKKWEKSVAITGVGEKINKL